MSDIKLYTTEELRKMSVNDRVKLMEGIIKSNAELVLNLRTGKEKQNHLKGAWEKQIARIQTLNNQANPKDTLSEAKALLKNNNVAEGHTIKV